MIKFLGAGAEGEAYLVEDQDGKDWVLKLIKLPLPRKCLDSILREIQLQSELGEVTVFGVKSSSMVQINLAIIKSTCFLAVMHAAASLILGLDSPWYYTFLFLSLAPFPMHR